MALCRMPQVGNGIRGSDGIVWNVIEVDENNIVYFDHRIAYEDSRRETRTEWNCFIGSFNEPVWCTENVTTVLGYRTAFNTHWTLVG